MLISLLWITIVVTFLGWSVPMLFLPHALMVRYRLPIAEPILFIRLLGGAYLALTMVYVFGLIRAYRGEDIIEIVIIGMISNGLAAATIWRYALRGLYNEWSRPTQWFIYFSGAVTTALALALLGVGVGYGG